MSNLPKLRFPEFRGGWEEKALGKVANIITGNTPKTADNSNYGGNKLFVSPADISGERYITSTKTTLTEQGFKKTRPVKANSIMFVCIGSTIGKVAQNKIKCATNQQINSVIPFDEYSNDYIYSFLEKNADKIADIAGNQAVPIINKTLFSSVSINCPINLEEQQKIANCLSSIDQVITAQTQKLDTLKAHKKGLMQKLFPAEGETTPKLRFPEFRDAGDWETLLLVDVSKEKLSNGVFNDPKKVGSGYRIINVLDMYIDGYIDENRLSLLNLTKTEFKKNKVESGDIFFTRSSLVKEGIAVSNIYLGESDNITFDGHLIRLKPNSEIISPVFLYFKLKSEAIRSQLIAKGKTATMTTIGQADVASTKLNIPSLKEQHEIANCLSSLDEIIITQTQKIETLKAHKKGLMQQLFPDNNEKSNT